MVILELIHAKNPDSGRGVFIRLKTSALRGSLVIHNNLTNRMALCRRWFIQISALSTFDGRIEVRAWLFLLFLLVYCISQGPAGSAVLREGLSSAPAK